MRPRLLDLFAGAGGAARGYQRAGFHVTGVDIKPQPRYAGDAFVQADALRPPFDLSSFDAIHASPPCQGYSRATAWRGSRDNHPKLIQDVRAMLEASGRPFVIENVEDARGQLRDPFMLCGSQFGIRVQRHRYFEAPSIPLALLPPCAHVDLIPFDHGGTRPESEYRDAMGCEWMTVHESREAIPPAYTEYLGRALLDSVRASSPEGESPEK